MTGKPKRLSPNLYLDIARRILPVPTAPFHEHFVVAEVQRFVEERPDLRLKVDPFGNLILRLGDKPPGLFLTAHLDHPGLGFARQEGGDLFFRRLGGVPDKLSRDAAVLVYGRADPKPIAKGRVTSFLVDGMPGDADRRPAFRVRLEDPAMGEVSEGAFAMWDLPSFEVAGRRLSGRACDDLAGVTVALTVMERLRQEGVGGTGVLLTRAEETGFGGMLAAVDEQALDRDAIYVNIECSSWRAGAPLGDGPVIRVGDRRWIFDAGVTGALADAAESVRERAPGFRYQRRLMDAGTCEATPLARSGRATGAVALPLDNYHNNGGRKLRAEAVDLDDAEGLVELLVQLARDPGAHAAVDAAVNALDAMLDERRGAQTPELLQTAIDGPSRTPGQERVG